MLKIGVQKNLAPSFKINDSTYQNADAQGVRLSMYNFEEIPVAVEFYFSKGYDSSIDFAYGTNLSYIFFSDTAHWLKLGFSGGRFKMGDFERGNTVGSIREDEFHENLMPFVEWDWRFSEYVNVFVQTGYRFLRSETETVTEIVDRYENGDPRQIRVSSDRRIYGSGFEFGLGLEIKLY
ncbi:MAG: hypothetical protein WD381_06625 [Balneolaceae bacterium]